MTDGLIRSFMMTRQHSFTPPGEFTMSRSVVPSIVYVTIIATLGIAGVAARGADRDRSGDVSTADATGACAGLPGHSALRSALVNARGQDNGGFDLDMWGAIVNRDGIVCAVAFTGTDRGKQWPGQPRDRRTEGQHRERLQPAAAWRSRPRISGPQYSRAAHCTACSTAIRSARAPRTTDRRVRSVSRTIRWSASASAA